MIRAPPGSVAALFTEKPVRFWVSVKVWPHRPSLPPLSNHRVDLWPPQGSCESPKARQLGAPTHLRPFTRHLLCHPPPIRTTAAAVAAAVLETLERKHQTTLIKASEPQLKLNNFEGYFYFLCDAICRGKRESCDSGNLHSSRAAPGRQNWQVLNLDRANFQSRWWQLTLLGTRLRSEGFSVQVSVQVVVVVGEGARIPSEPC